MPAAFIGHGSPMNALEHNRYTDAWRDFGGSVPRPRAVLVICAHWYINATAVTAMRGPARSTTSTASPRSCSPSTTRHRDYRSSPKRSPTSFSRRGSARTSTAGASTTARGRCSSTSSRTPRSRWCSCRSTQTGRSTTTSTSARELAPLRARGVLIVGSGNIVHNLASMHWQLADEGFDWAQRFDDAARTQMLHDPDGFGRLAEHADFDAAVPTPDHFLPSALPRRSGGGGE